MVATPWIRHILNSASDNETQHCILCGAAVAPHMLGGLPEGTVYEHDGRLMLIEPLGNTISCRDRQNEGEN